jgi:hypothetical protein
VNEHSHNQPRLRIKLLREDIIYPGTQGAGTCNNRVSCHVMVRALFLQHGMLPGSILWLKTTKISLYEA